MPPRISYETRITTFIDILGFSRDVLALPTHPRLLPSIEAVLSRLQKCKSDIDRARADRGVLYDARMTCFSDCVVISYKPEPAAALRAVNHAAFIGRVLLAGGYLPRGAIAIGCLMHNEALLFGEALITAYNEERCRVNTPRIKLMNPLRTMVLKELAGNGKSGLEFIVSDHDETFVDILGNRWDFLEDERLDRNRKVIAGHHVDEIYSEMRDSLILRFENAPHESARDKIRWMAEYVNRTIDRHKLANKFKVNLPSA